MSNYLFSTFGDVVDEAYDELSVDGDSTPYPALSRTNMEKKGNRYAKRFLSKVNLPTREGNTSFYSVADTTVSTEAAAGAGTIVLTAVTGMDTTGGMIIVDDIPYEYASIAGTTVTLATGVTTHRIHEVGEDVRYGYPVPSDFLRPFALFVGTNEYVIVKSRTQKDVKYPTYAQFGNFLLLPPFSTATAKITLRYAKKGTNTLATSDTMEIFDMFDDYVINKLVSYGHRMMYDFDSSKLAKDEAQEVLTDARSHVNKQDDSNKRRFLPGF